MLLYLQYHVDAQCRSQVCDEFASTMKIPLTVAATMGSYCDMRGAPHLIVSTSRLGSESIEHAHHMSSMLLDIRDLTAAGLTHHKLLMHVINC